ncbi:hypothetical protein NLJ89_g3602 [Agrocybe chaxingu]|uniref:Uncharacterized protein n=1 Tax=Agrocybe chaxingu TaxID=84603 RepID=A0A9W8MY87_9AGAR|nr:hypothetical protein NLJ89_g3602 [Agrocybe chaxingu]
MLARTVSTSSNPPRSSSEIFVVKDSVRASECLLSAGWISADLVEWNGWKPLTRAAVHTWYTEGPALDNAEIEYTNQTYDERYHEGLGTVKVRGCYKTQ